MSAGNKYTLIYPVTFEGEVVKELTHRRLTVGDRRRITKSHADEVDREIQAAADACDLPFELIELLDGVDYDNLLQRMLDEKKS